MKRFQMSCRHKWRAGHPDAVIVARPSKWGNSFKIGGFYHANWLGDPLPGPSVFQESKSNVGNLLMPPGTYEIIDAEQAVRLFIAWAKSQERWRSWPLDELAGRDVFCWCPLWDETKPCPRCGGSGGLVYPPQMQKLGREVATCGCCEGTGCARYPCHGDVLLRLANPAIDFPWQPDLTLAA